MGNFIASNPFQAGGANSLSWYPSTYPVTSPSGVVMRNDVVFAPAASLTPDPANARYTWSLTAAESTAATYKFTFSDATGIRDIFEVECVEYPLVSLLASRSDLLAYGYGETAVDKLAIASTRVRGYVKQAIDYGTSTRKVRFPFLLPDRPVIAVTSVTDEDGVALTAGSDYTLEGQKLVVASGYRGELLTVVYTHGFSTLPERLVELVCRIAVRIHDTPHGLTAGMSAEGASGEQTTYGMDAYTGVTDLTSEEKRVLDELFPHTRRVPSVAMTL